MAFAIYTVTHNNIVDNFSWCQADWTNSKKARNYPTLSIVYRQYYKYATEKIGEI